MFSSVQTLSFTLTVTAVLVCSICIRRVYFHAFSHVPGPLLAKITNAYSAYHAVRRNTHVVIHRLHEKYGTGFGAWNYKQTNVLTEFRPCSAIWTRQDPVQQPRVNGRYVQLCKVLLLGPWLTALEEIYGRKNNLFKGRAYSAMRVRHCTITPRTCD